MGMRAGKGGQVYDAKKRRRCLQKLAAFCKMEYENKTGSAVKRFLKKTADFRGSMKLSN
jgi:hypothetical protein